MNKRDTAIQRNNRARLVRHSNRCGSHRGCVRLSTSVTWEHELAKTKLAWELMKRGHEVLTEAIFETGGRADVLDLDTGIAYEIVKSESIDSLQAKARKYPQGISIVAVDSMTGEETYVR